MHLTVQSAQSPSFEGQSVKPSTSRSFYSGLVSEFLNTDADAILGRLTSRQTDSHFPVDPDQLRAWKREIELLRKAFAEVGPISQTWSVLMETPLLRLGKRLDAVVIAPGVIAVIEFKIGGTAYGSVDRTQAEYYAFSLRDFHEVSQRQLIVPILCVEHATRSLQEISVFEGVAALLMANQDTLGQAFISVAGEMNATLPALDALAFDLSPYRPTPTIVEAAQALYRGHQIADIGRGDAADAELQAAAEVLKYLAAEAERSRQRVICFVTGAPGAGKTLLGLDLALKSRSGNQPAALLSGNRPLVHVLTEALAIDYAFRVGGSKKQAKYEADASIQNLLGYLKEHTEGAKPPENVIVFDEAQRAWDEEVGQELMGRPTSEPELFLNILERLDWSCLVCLVGPGQEINRGEGGLPLWGQALSRAQAENRPWQIIAAPQALDGGPAVAGAGLLSGGVALDESRIRRESRLHLANAIRAYRNPLQGLWVAALLQGQISEANALADKMKTPPAFLTRNLETAKAWLRERRRGGRSVGLLTSSGAVRLVGEGIPPAPRSNELGPIGHWFLKPYTDFRSSSALETPMSEFGCQGLELDYTGLCWGGDLIWSNDHWVPRMMRAPRWQTIREAEKHRFRLNGYRVLLTRARAGSVIFVPRGETDDLTRAPDEAASIAQTLIAAGCSHLDML